MATNEPTQVLDVRDVDGEPFGQIDATLSELDDGDRLLLVNGFEPVPLYDVLVDRGFEYETEQMGPTEWHVRIERR
ncbi:DUF2249 domain-containing protein [Haloarchaeobius baliensis]|uniref:DUF2249 domain-containing protein n=1 Tax=Haloarchaeobius baliensis TaxID=1670458 RepID=UPI003F8849A6